MSNGTDRIIAAIEAYGEPVLRELGLEMVEVQYRQESHGWVVRFFIDKEEGVTVDDCAAVSRAISAWLDVEDLIEHAFHLEVSSPGLERPLKRPQDFKRFAGRNARIKIKEPRDGQRVFTGILGEIQDNEFILMVDEQPISISFEEIAKARLLLL